MIALPFMMRAQLINQTSTDGLKQGYWIETDTAEDVVDTLKGNYVDGQREGIWLKDHFWRQTFRDSLLIPYHKGVRHGVSEEWSFVNGKAFLTKRQTYTGDTLTDTKYYYVWDEKLTEHVYLSAGRDTLYDNYYGDAPLEYMTYHQRTITNFSLEEHLSVSRNHSSFFYLTTGRFTVYSKGKGFAPYLDEVTDKDGMLGISRRKIFNNKGNMRYDIIVIDTGYDIVWDHKDPDSVFVFFANADDKNGKHTAPLYSSQYYVSEYENGRLIKTETEIIDRYGVHYDSSFHYQPNGNRRDGDVRVRDTSYYFEFYETGELKCKSVFPTIGPVVESCFYESGRLKSKEHRLNAKSKEKTSYYQSGAICSIITTNGNKATRKIYGENGPLLCIVKSRGDQVKIKTYGKNNKTVRVTISNLDSVYLDHCPDCGE